MHEALTDIFQQPQNTSAMEDTLELYTRGNDLQISLIGPANFTTRYGGGHRPTRDRSHETLIPRQLDSGQGSLCELNDIAVVGMSGRFPGSDDLDGFWKTLSLGHDLCQQVNLQNFLVTNN